jgi:short-subunit dehydrogenase
MMDFAGKVVVVTSAVSGREEQAFDAMAQTMLLTPPEDCAADIIAGLERGRRRIVTGHRSRALWWLSRFVPNRYPGVLRALAR